MDIRSFLLTLIMSLSVGIFIGFTLRDVSEYLLQVARKHLIKPRFLKPYQAISQAVQQTNDKQDSKAGV